MKKKFIQLISVMLTAILLFGLTAFSPATVSTAAASPQIANYLVSMLPLVTYANPLSGLNKVYAYTDEYLTYKHTGYYIDTFIDQIVITKISEDGRAVLVVYPSSSAAGGFRSLWFSVDDILGISSVSISTYTASSDSSTYKLSSASSVVSSGSIYKRDFCLSLGTRIIGGRTYFITCYPIGTTTVNKVSGIKYKIALAAQGPPVQNVTPLQTTVYLQTDSRWSSTKYGFSDAKCTQQATVGSAGCGLLALTNAVGYLTGCFLDPSTLAKFSLDKNQRENGVGTKHSFFKIAADEYGVKAGFKYVKETVYDADLIAHLKSGGTAIAVVPDHFIAIVAYGNSTGKFLVYDSYPSSNRGTTANGDWKTQNEINSGGLKTQKFFLIAKR